MEDYILNDHNKDEFPPAHTAEHLLNQLMMRMFGCERSSNAHIERKKSKISYILDHKPDRKEEREIERQMNELIEQDLPVTFQFVTRAELEGIVMEAEPGSPDSRIALDRLPADASERKYHSYHIDDERRIPKRVSDKIKILQKLSE